MRDQHDMEQLASVEQMESNGRIEEQSARIQELEAQLQQMQSNNKQAYAAVEIVNRLHTEGVIAFNDEGQCNVIGNAHEQIEESEPK